MTVARVYLATFSTFLIVDALWLVLVAGPVFSSRLGDWLRESPDVAAIVLFYASFPAGLLVLAVHPAIEKRSLSSAIGKGFVVGLMAYATFDLTALAILKRYAWDMAIMDMAWGAVAGAIASAAGYRASGSVQRRPVPNAP
jgi:uncharacterized membrane protein